MTCALGTTKRTDAGGEPGQPFASTPHQIVRTAAEAMTDSDLITQAQRGDGEAIASLYERHAARVYTTVRRLADDDAQAEDWAQEAWIRAIRALPSFRGESLFSTWIHRIALNCALYGRRRRASREAQDAARAMIGRRSEAFGEDDLALLRMQLSDAVDRLPEGMRKVLVLHDVEGYTHEEIGSLLGIAAGTCKSQLFKARAKMRAMLRHTKEGEEICST
jgi:RNA polymerase sigma-70 factor, ECF subfamily